MPKFRHTPEALAKLRASQSARKERNAAFKLLRKNAKLAQKEQAVPQSVAPPASTISTESDAIALEAAAIARLMERIRDARKDPCDFVEFVMRTPQGVPLKLAPFQREWLYAMARERRLLVEASRFHGKCSPGNARVLLASGEQVRIDSLVDNESKVIAYDDIKHAYVSKRAVAFSNGIKPVFKVTIATGRELEVTSEHPLLTWDGWVPLSKLKVGDYVGVPAKLPELGAEEIPADISWLMGLLIGDGTLNGHVASVTIDDQTVVDALNIVCANRDWLAKTSPQVDRTPTYRIRRRDKSHATKLHTPWTLLNGTYGLQSGDAYSKRVPESIFKAKNTSIAEFLAGYLDSDAHVNPLRGGSVEYYSVSKDLLRDVQSLLMRLGVHAHLSLKNGKYKGANHVSWRLTIRGVTDLKLFRELIKPRGSRVEALNALALDGSNKHDRLPPNWKDSLSTSVHKLAKYHKVYVGNNHATSKHKALSAAVADNNDALTAKLNQPVRWLPIKSIEAIGDMETFGIEVEDLHNYITEDFITHNTTLTIAFCLWMLGNNPNLRIKFFCQNDKRAKERLFELRQNIEKNAALKLVFPNLKQSQDGEWTKTSLIVERSGDFKDASFEAIGITSSVTGGRADVVVCDDVCDLRTSVLYPSMREQIIQKFKGEMLPMLDPKKGKIIYIATPWHRADLTSVLQQSTEWLHKRYAVGTDDDRTLPIWPEQWPRVELERMLREQGSIEYDRAFRCISYSADSILCKPEWIKYYTRDLLGNPRNLICIQAYDLAISQTSSADYFAGVTVLYDTERNIAFVADFFQTRCSFSEQGNIVIRNFLRWEADRVWIESVGLGGGLFSYLEENGPKNMPMFAYKPKGDKQRRLMEATPWLEGGKLYFHPNMDPQRNVLDIDTGDLVTQLLEFPICKHDDLVDALVSALFGLLEFKVKENESGWHEGEGLRARVSVME